MISEIKENAAEIASTILVGIMLGVVIVLLLIFNGYV
jgi:uncharacterized membrane protein SpoIIM required for sporulation